MRDVLNVVMVHQRRAFVDRLLTFWAPVTRPDRLLLVHGGAEADFREISHPHKMFVGDPRLRTRDHQRELQSITGILHAVRDWLTASAVNCEFLYFAEYDHLPLVPDLNARQISRMETEAADVLAFHLERIDDTSHPHYLYHVAKPAFHAFFADLTRRGEPEVTLAMLGTGSFWRREAFDAVAAVDEPFPMYQEVYIPTLAHHLGFRLRGYAEQNRFVSPAGDRASEIEGARAAGAWTLHPVKQLP